MGQGSLETARIQMLISSARRLSSESPAASTITRSRRRCFTVVRLRACKSKQSQPLELCPSQRSSNFRECAPSTSLPHPSHFAIISKTSYEALNAFNIGWHIQAGLNRRMPYPTAAKRLSSTSFMLRDFEQGTIEI
jgi:hypothetical protein